MDKAYRSRVALFSFISLSEQVEGGKGREGGGGVERVSGVEGLKGMA